jgi:hypothetical protein
MMNLLPHGIEAALINGLMHSRHMSARRSTGPPARALFPDKIHQHTLSQCSQDEIASV